MILLHCVALPIGFFRPSKRVFVGMILLSFLTIRGVLALPVESNPEDVRPCRLIGDVTGTSGYGKNLRWQPIAKTHAARKAENLGATHIVYIRINPTGAENGEVMASAYLCP